MNEPETVWAVAESFAVPCASVAEAVTAETCGTAEVTAETCGWSVQAQDPVAASSFIQPNQTAQQSWANVASKAAACPQPPTTTATAAAAAATTSTEEAAWDIFAKSIKAVFQGWTSLRLAVENNWGGGNSLQKAETFVIEVVQMFKSRRSIDCVELEDYLDGVMDEEFSCELEDGSQKEVCCKV